MILCNRASCLAVLKNDDRQHLSVGMVCMHNRVKEILAGETIW